MRICFDSLRIDHCGLAYSYVGIVGGNLVGGGDVVDATDTNGSSVPCQDNFEKEEWRERREGEWNGSAKH
jgi:hypothetical protein